MLEWILGFSGIIVVALLIFILLRFFWRRKRIKNWYKMRQERGEIDYQDFNNSHYEDRSYYEHRQEYQVEQETQSKIVPQLVLPQRVEFAVFSPRKISKGSTFILDVWAYLPEFYNSILLFARELGRDALIGRKIGVPIEKGAILGITVEVLGLEMVDSFDTIIWEGQTTNASFSINVPHSISMGEFPGKVIIKCQGITIAKLLFVISVTSTEDSEYNNRSTTTIYPKSAFASYASENREEVFSRIHGMKKVAPDLDVFVDVFSLRSGENWKEKLEQHVPTKDLFYLFWSHYAAQSEWVEREWRLALGMRGLDYIDPVPLESIDQAPPPLELQAIHFADAYVNYIQYLRLKKH